VVTSLNAGRHNGCHIRIKIFEAVKMWYNRGKNAQMKKD
jgi:hypothetical protein